jgi:predicted O-methyltransferase YrrM
MTLTTKRSLKRSVKARLLRLLDPALQFVYKPWNKEIWVDSIDPSLHRGALSGHLATLFWTCVTTKPRLIVEVGVRGGTSTDIFCRAAGLFGSTIISVDVEETSFYTDYPAWHFFRERSQDLASRFNEVRSSMELGAVDLLFLDSSHLYEETREELTFWLPHLAQDGVLIFHDTAMSPIYRSLDGTLRVGWDNHRGVTRAIEEVLNIDLSERRNFVDLQGYWAINHTPLSSGLTILKRTN